MSGTWVWAGATAIGTSHLATGAPCQDAIDCTVWRCNGESPVLIAALADGAGSAAREQFGARRATQVFVDVAHQAFEEGADCTEVVLRHAVEQARLALDLTAGHVGCAIDDLAATLLVAILSPAGGAIGQIGDGAVVIDDGEAGWRPVHWPDHGEYANTTSFLTQADALDVLRLAVLERPAARLAMFSDGLERLLLDFRTRTAHCPSSTACWVGSAAASLKAGRTSSLTRSRRCSARTRSTPAPTTTSRCSVPPGWGREPWPPLRKLERKPRRQRWRGR